MSRTTFLKSLRIAWSVAWGIVAMLLVVLWARSYASMQLWHFSRQHAAMVAEGTIMFDGAWVPTDRVAPYDSGGIIQTWDHGPHYIYDREGGLDIDCWESIIAVVVIGIAPWLPWRFSLRTLLFAIAVIAVVLGLIVLLKHKAPSLRAELPLAPRTNGGLICAVESEPCPSTSDKALTVAITPSKVVALVIGDSCDTGKK